MSSNVLASLSRSIYMEFEKDVEVKGIPAYRFTPPRSVLASKEENPANEGFCVSQDECLGTGVLKVSPCRRGKCQLAQPIFSPAYLLFHMPLSKYSVLCPSRSVYHEFNIFLIILLSCIYLISCTSYTKPLCLHSE